MSHYRGKRKEKRNGFDRKRDYAIVTNLGKPLFTCESMDTRLWRLKSSPTSQFRLLCNT